MRENAFIDIHSHIMPGMDDGAKSLAESLGMLRQAQEEGIGAVVLTPHQKPGHRCVTAAEIKKRTDDLRKEAKREGIGVELYPGGELYYCHGLEKRLRAGKAPTLAESGYVLVEFMPGEEFRYIRNAADALLCAGYRPLIAHAERYGRLMQEGEPERAEELVEMGCLFQVNSASLMGGDGWALRKWSRLLVKNRLAHFVATDAHREQGGRTVQLRKCAAFLGRKYGTEYAAKLLFENAKALLDNRKI